jgi:hypothetical protein
MLQERTRRPFILDSKEEKWTKTHKLDMGKNS